MPEGPSIVILKDALLPFKGRRVTAASGYAKNVNSDMLTGNTLTAIKTWGKHLLLVFEGFTLRVHMGLFGSYKINEPVKRSAALHLQFGNDEVNFSISKIEVIEGQLDKVYDWSADIMCKKWDEKKAMEKLRAKPALMICDALLDQKIFSGSGNIIKNESLFRARIHPESLSGKIPEDKLQALLKDVVKFSSDFLKWRKAGVLKKTSELMKKITVPVTISRFTKPIPEKLNAIVIIAINARYCTINY